MDVELHQQVLTATTVLAGLLVVVVAWPTDTPHVTDGQIDEKVIVRFAKLQETLAPLYILHQIGGVTPDGVGGRHVDAGIELPTGPGIILGRVTGAVEVDVIHTAGKHQVQVGLHLR